MLKVSKSTSAGRYRAVRSWALGLSLVGSAYLMAVAVSSTDHAWLGWLSLSPLLLSIRYASPLRALACGLLWGSALWLFAVLLGGGEVVGPGIWSLALLAGVPGAYAFFGSLLTRSRVGFSPLLLGMAWVGVEYALSPLSLRFGLLSGTFAQGSFLHILAGMLGYGCIAFVIAYANGLLLSLLSEVRIKVPGPLYVLGSIDPGALILSGLVPYRSLGGFSAARPRAPPIC